MPLLYSLINALRGNATIDRITCAALTAVLLAGWHYVIIFFLVWFGLSWGWCLALTAGTGPRDWHLKFKPSGWILGILKPRNIYIYGAIGTAIRTICFYPAIIFVHGWGAFPYMSWFSVWFVASYYAGGLIGRLYPKLADNNVRMAEILWYPVLGWVLVA